MVNLFQQGQQQPLLLNLELAAQAYKKSRGKAVPLTQDRFEQFWYGNDSAHGFVDDPYISYFWPQCPYIEDYILKISSAFDGLFHNVCPVTTKASRIKKEALS